MKKTERRDYWKVVCPEFPGGIICRTLRDAQDFATNEREVYEKGEVYIRKIRMMEKDFNELSDDI